MVARLYILSKCRRYQLYVL